VEILVLEFRIPLKVPFQKHSFGVCEILTFDEQNKHYLILGSKPSQMRYLQAKLLGGRHRGS